MERPSLHWSSSPERIYFAYADGGRSPIGWVSLDGRMGIAAGGKRACLSFSVATETGRLAFGAADALNPGEVFVSPAGGSGERRITAINDAWLAGLSLSEPQRLAFTCGDGQTIEGWLMRPPGFAPGQRCPLILQVHGGPHYPLGERFYLEFQRLAALGYMILYCNPRGSQGYGERFATRIRGAWGERDYADLMQAIDALLEAGEVDPERMAVTGVSYGGFMTNWIIGHTPRFRAAICENGISNLTSNFATSVHGAAFWDWEMDGTPATQPERYRAHSPLSYAAQMRTPLLLIHAQEDQNCALAQSEELFAALRSLQREVSLLPIPGEGHLMNLVGTPGHRLMRAAAIDEWLQRWLG